MVAILLALAAAAVYGTGTALQHHAASTTADGLHPALLLRRLLRRRGWLAGLVLSGVAFVLHVAALHEGPLTVVQPIVVTTVVFAVLVRSALDRTPPSRAEVAWCVCTWFGLALVVGSVPPGPPLAAGEPRFTLLVVAVVVVVAAAAGLMGYRTAVPLRRGVLFGVAAGVLYGSTAALVKVSTAYPAVGPASVARHWSTWVLVATGLGGFVFSQQAYKAARLSVTVPLLNMLDVLVAVAVGLVVFGDRLYDAPRGLLVEFLGFALVAVGIWRLVRESERLHAHHEAAVRAEPDHRPR